MNKHQISFNKKFAILVIVEKYVGKIFEGNYEECFLKVGYMVNNKIV